jgi:hypothetical protein
MLSIIRHADTAKLKATLEGVKKGHAIAMEERNAQLRRVLANNSNLEEQLKDQQRVGLQKQKELEDVRSEAADSEKQLRSYIKIFGYLHNSLLGTFCFTLCMH